jgi:vitellogenic carboxypeptidase-like protein
LIYNGQLDVIIAWPLTENFITSMKWSGAKNYTKTDRQQWHVGSDLAGYVKQIGDFTQVLVRNAGHMVPYDQPKWAFDLINRFTSGKKFD